MDLGGKLEKQMDTKCEQECPQGRMRGEALQDSKPGRTRAYRPDLSPAYGPADYQHWFRQGWKRGVMR